MAIGKPLVSVIIPVYNSERFLGRALHGVLSQTIKDIEVILCVSRKSTDESVVACEEYAEREPRIRVLARYDQGLGDARNAGLALAHGEYISFVDVDDTIEPEFLEHLVDPLERTEADVSICGFDRRWSDGTVKPGWLPPEEGMVKTDFVSYYAKVWYGVVWNKLYRRDWLQRESLRQPVGNHEDDGWHMMIAARVRHVFFVQEELYHYTQDNAKSLMQDPAGRLQYFDSMGTALDDLDRAGLLEQNRHEVRRILRVRQRHFELEYPRELRFRQAAETLYARYLPEEIVWQQTEVASIRRAPGRGGVVLFGAGADGQNLLRELGCERVRAFIDNNPECQGKKVEGITVMSLSEHQQSLSKVEIMVASSKYREEIINQLMAAGVTNFIVPENYFLRERFSFSRRHIVLLNTPRHSNLGDHAIALQEKSFFARYFPEYDLVEIDEDEAQGMRWQIKELVGHEDIIVLTGGGYLGSLWVRKGEQAFRNAIMDFPENLIVVFPQTLYFEDSAYGRQERQISEKYYRSAQRLLLFLRERKSYERACALLGSAENCRLVPDIVLSWRVPDARKREKGCVAMCLKDNQESIQTARDKEKVRRALADRGWQIEDITMYAGYDVLQQNRKLALQRQIQLLRQYEAVVTDALHGMIFCAVAGVPCVALDNVSGKLSGVYEWIREISYIALASSAKEVGTRLSEVVNQDGRYAFPYKDYAEEIAQEIRSRIVQEEADV